MQCMTMRCMTIMDAVVLAGLLMLQPPEKRPKVFVQLLVVALVALGWRLL